jgi:hypothetical protein
MIGLRNAASRCALCSACCNCATRSFSLWISASYLLPLRAASAAFGRSHRRARRRCNAGSRRDPRAPAPGQNRMCGALSQARRRMSLRGLRCSATLSPHRGWRAQNCCSHCCLPWAASRALGLKVRSLSCAVTRGALFRKAELRARNWLGPARDSGAADRCPCVRRDFRACEQSADRLLAGRWCLSNGQMVGFLFRLGAGSEKFFLTND